VLGWTLTLHRINRIRPIHHHNVESRTLFEIEGGIYIQGRHNRPQGFAADAEKYLEAALAGWRVLRLTEPQITAPMIERIIRFVVAETPATLTPPPGVSCCT